MSQNKSVLFGMKKNRNGIFSISDVIVILTESVDPVAYWKKLKERLKKEGNETVTNGHGLKMPAENGKLRETDVADTEHLLRLRWDCKTTRSVASAHILTTDFNPLKQKSELMESRRLGAYEQ